MGTINHFTAGPLTPALAYVLSSIGSALGLLCTSRARVQHGVGRVRWLVLAAVSIGGTGIWVMHFVAMLGFSVEGSPIRYDVTRTILSLGVAVLFVGAGMAVAGRGEPRPVTLAAGGLLTGAGVASMHYLGMSAIQVHAELDYGTVTVTLSVVVAVVASTAALWAALNVRGAVATTCAALIMGVAVSGMHYTGMAALSADMSGGGVLDGAEATQFLAPLITGISLFTVVTLFIVALSPGEDELREESELRDRLRRLTTHQEQAREAVRRNAARRSPARRR